MIPAMWTAMYSELPLHEALRVLHGHGWRAFEISTEHLVAIETDRDPDSLIGKAGECLRSLGISTPQAHALLNANVADPDAAKRETDIRRLQRHIAISARLGVRTVVIHPGGRRDAPDPALIDKLNIEAFRRLGDHAGERGVRIAIENMTRPGFTTASEMLGFLDRINHAAMGITLDTSHANMSGVNVAAAVREYGPQIVATHISDNNGSGDQHLTPGGGTIDWPAAMQAFADIGYNGPFNLEIPGERHQNPALRELKLRHAFAVSEWLVGLAASAAKP